MTCFQVTAFGRKKVHLTPVSQIYWRLQYQLVAVLDTGVDLDLSTVVGRDCDLVQTGDAVFDDRHLQTVLIEDDSGVGQDQRRRLPWDLQLDRAIDPRLQRAIRIGYVDLGQQAPRPRLQRIGDPRHFAMKGEVGHRGHAKDRLDAWLDAKGFILRHINPNADLVAVGHRKHGGAAGRVRRDQAADVDVALRDQAVERSDNLLIDLLLIEIFQLRLHCRGIVLRGRRRVLLGL